MIRSATARALILALVFAPVHALASDNSLSFGHSVFGVTLLGLTALGQTCYDKHGNLQPQCRNQAPPVEAPDPLLRNPHTAELRRALNIERVAAGQPPDPENCDAHHIVPKNEARIWASEYAKEARAILESCQIDLDSADNGIYLPSRLSGAQCAGSYHKTLHTAKYYKDIAQRLFDAKEESCSEVSTELRLIKHDLLMEKY